MSNSDTPPPLLLKTHGAGIASLAIAGVVLVVLLAMISGIWDGMALKEMGLLSLALLGCLIVVLIGCCITGVILGIIGHTQPHVRKRWSVVGWVLNGFQLVGITALLIIEGGKWSALHTLPFRTRLSIRTDDVATRPIPISPKALTKADLTKVRRQWYERQMVEAYSKFGNHAPKWDELSQQLMQVWMKIYLEDPDAPMKFTFMPLAWNVRDLGCDDPLILFLCGKSIRGLEDGKELYRKSMERFRQSKYPRIFAFLASIEYGKAIKELGEEAAIQKADEASLAFLKEALADESYRSEELYLFLDELKDRAFFAFFERRGKQVCKTFDECPRIEKWICHTLWGYHYVELAWEARGSGYANTVTPAGWKGFHKNLQRAEHELTDAWRLNPNHPYAATKMITVSLDSEHARSDMRMWFDRAVSARLDHDKAYDSFLWGLRPRWHGSHEDMLNFGEQCLKTARFDTNVPYQYVWTVINISSDLDDSDEIFRRPEIYQKLKQTMEGYLSEPKQNAHQKVYHSQYAILAYLAGHYEDARRHLEAVEFQPDAKTVRDWDRDLTEMVGEVCALTSPARDIATKAAEAFDRYETAEALKLYESAVELAKEDRWAFDFFQDRVAILKLEGQLEKGDWVPFLPESTLCGWHVENGQWNLLEDGALESKAGEHGNLIHSRARVGGDFEIKGEIEYVTSTTGKYQAGVVFGDPSMEKWRWMSFRVASWDGEIALLSKRFSRGEKTVHLPIPNKNKFHIRAWQGKLTVWLNDQLLIENFTAPEDSFVRGRENMIGFGGYNDGNEAVLRYRNIMVRRLTSPPAPLDKKS